MSAACISVRNLWHSSDLGGAPCKLSTSDTASGVLPSDLSRPSLGDDLERCSTRFSHPPLLKTSTALKLHKMRSGYRVDALSLEESPAATRRQLGSQGHQVLCAQARSYPKDRPRLMGRNP